jgi:Skp family chaperone for outer membrane proteins
MWRRALILALLQVALCLSPGMAQQVTATPDFKSPILTIDQTRLFTETLFGKAALARLKAGEDALLAENLEIETALEEEERSLTEQRAVLPAAEFRALADAFDTKVEGLRAAQRAKYTDLTAQLEADRQRFGDAALPTIGALMQELGAIVVVDEQSVVVSLRQVDVTTLVISRLNAAIGDGSTMPAPVPTPQPTPAPQPTPVQP